MDASGDGSISALDALRVINEVARAKRAGSTSGEGESINSALASAFMMQPQDEVRGQETEFDDILNV